MVSVIFSICSAIIMETISRDNDNKLEASYIDINRDLIQPKTKISQHDYFVSNKVEFLECLGKAQSGDVIYIDDDASIDLTGIHKLNVGSGITIASGRGENGSRGALIKTNMHGTAPLFKLLGDNIKITGIRLQGPDTGMYYDVNKKYITPKGFTRKKNFKDDFSKKMDLLPRSTGVVVLGSSNIIENCEIYGWTFAGVSIIHPSSETVIAQNYIHHNQHFGLGYGVLFDRARGIVKSNVFDYNNHSVTGTGNSGTGFDVYDNIFKENHARSWAVDMHGGRDRKDNTNMAGSEINVYDNKFYLYHTRPAIVVRGIPKNYSRIENNTFYYRRGKKSVEKYIQIRKQIGLAVNIKGVTSDNLKTAIRTEGNFNLQGNKVVEVE